MPDQPSTSTNTAVSTPPRPSVAPEEEEEQPFTLVSSKRRPRCRRNPATGNFSNSNGSLATSSSSAALSGFTYASSSSTGRRRAKSKHNAAGESNEQRDEEAERVVKRAIETVDVFVRYLGCELGSAGRRRKGGSREEGGGRPTFAEELAECLRDVWPRGSGDGGTSRGGGSSSGSCEENVTSAVDTAAAIATGATSAATSTANAKATAREHPANQGSGNQAESKGAMIPTQIICLGLGSPTTSRSAQVQLALMVVIREYLRLGHDQHQSTRTAHHPTTIDTLPAESVVAASHPIPCLAHDPIFTPADHLLLSHYAVHACDSTTIAATYTSISTPTLLYMPHCDRSLYETLLSLNPTSPAVLLLCNVLANYTIDPRLERDAPTLHATLGRFELKQLPNWTADRKPLVRQGMDEHARQDVGRMTRWWDKNALRDLGFHWIPAGVRE